MMDNIFFQISMLLLVVFSVSVIMRFLKQPLIIGYILAGIIVGPPVFNLIPKTEILQTFSEFGVAFLLFIVGISLNPKSLKEVGKISLITGVGQVLFTSIFGYLLGLLMGFSSTTSIYIAVALTFSSTIIIMKLLSDKGSLDTLYGKISIGFLLVQDLIAILILIVISSLATEDSAGKLILMSLLKGAGLFLALFIMGRFILPKADSFLARSQELLFIFSISWGLGLGALFLYAGFSIEVGALVAGIMLSMTAYSSEVSSRLKPLRDFFIISFFILLGSQMVFGEISNLIWPTIIFSAFILIGNPLIVISLMGLFGYSKRTGFLAGLTVAQISEFSLILIALGVKIGHLESGILSFVTIIGLITIAGSTYMIMYSDKIYSVVSPLLAVFEKKGKKSDRLSYGEKEQHEVVLFGRNRIGYDILESLKHSGKRTLVVDYNPDTIKDLKGKGICCCFGDAGDIELLNEINFRKTKMIISTIPDPDTNLLIIDYIRKINPHMIIINISHQINDALKLYEYGSSYVLMPHFVGGKYMANLLQEYGFDFNKFLIEKEKHQNYLKKRKQMGHEHPKAERLR